MANKTKTYIAGDWTNDKDAIDKLYEWNKDNNLNLTFTDAHSLTQANDDSLNCSIKRSLLSRLNSSKTFVLIVGTKTNSLKSGSCSYCESYWSTDQSCLKDYSVDLKSYIDYECKKAIDKDLKIVVLYKSTNVLKSNCPSIIKDKGSHLPMKKRNDLDKIVWDYQAIKNKI